MKRFGLFFWLCSMCLSAQEFKPLRYDDDFSYLSADSTRSIYEEFKYLPLHEKSGSFASLGGDFRFQYFRIKNEDWGEAPSDPDGYILNRSLFHADFHISEAFRFFAQLQSSIASGRIDPSPVEENPLDLHQVFADFTFGPNSRKGTLRVGRQEMMFGSQRLISVREYPNSRLAFDGLRLIVSAANWKSDWFYAHPTANRPGIFDDDFNDDAKVWGSYTTLTSVRFIQNIDLYYIGIWKRDAVFNDVQGRELRHSVGTRIWKDKGDWQYDFEAVLQFGKLEGSGIVAWTVSSNTTYRFSDMVMRPRLGLKTEVISGDKNLGDGRLETFNPLYPRGAYFGLAGIIGPSNLIDIHPELLLAFAKGFEFGLDYDIFWRFSVDDGLYAPNMQLIYPGESDETFIGTQLSGNISWKPNSFFLLKLEGMWFDAGNYLKAVGPGEAILFAAVTAQLRF